MNFFSNQDKEMIEKTLDTLEANKNEEQTIRIELTEEIKPMLLYALDCYVEAFSDLTSLGLDLSSLGIKYIWFKTPLPCAIDNIHYYGNIYTFYFKARTNGKKTELFSERYYGFRKVSIKSVKKTVQRFINTGNYEISKNNRICVPVGLDFLRILICKNGDFQERILSKEEIKENIRNKILEDVKAALKEASK